LGKLVAGAIGLGLAAGVALVASAVNSDRVVALTADDPKITLSATSGTAASEFTVTGTGFAPNETIKLYVEAPGAYESGVVVADRNGGFTIPHWQMLVWGLGTHQICAQASIVRVCAPFTSEPFNPTISLNVTSGGPGTELTVSMRDFPPGSEAAMYVDVPSGNTDTPVFFGTPGVPFDEHGNRDQPTRWPVYVSTPGAYNVCAETGSKWARESKYPAKVCALFVVEGVASSPSPPPLAIARPNRPGPPLLGLLAVLVVLVPAAVAGVIRLVRNPRRGTRNI
jgi:hypothetical protein